jgi:hypothetical protein
MSAFKKLIAIWVKYEKYDDLIGYYEYLADEALNFSKSQNDSTDTEETKMSDFSFTASETPSTAIVTSPQPQAFELKDTIVEEPTKEASTIKDVINEYTMSNYIEQEMKKNCVVKKELVEKLAQIEKDTPYVLLNKGRAMTTDDGFLDEEFINDVLALDFSGDKFDFYGELLYFLMRQNIDISDILEMLKEKGDAYISVYLEYIRQNFKNFPKILGAYLKSYDDNTILKRAYVILEREVDEFYISVFEQYIEEGIDSIEYVYRAERLDEEYTKAMKNHEEMFFLYMRKAYHARDNDEVKSYVIYLKKALESYGYVRSGIEFLVNKVESDLDKEEAILSEFDEYKKIVKSNINFLIQAKQIDDVRLIIDEYLKIVPDDVEMQNLKIEFAEEKKH